MFSTVGSKNEFDKLINSEYALLAYFSAESCNVCQVLKPKIGKLIDKSFPKIKSVHIKIEQLPEIAGQYRVFAAPTLLLFFNGKETIRKSRNISIYELQKEIARHYSFIF